MFSMMLRFLPSSTPAKLFEFYGSGSEVVEEKQQHSVAMRDAKRKRATPAEGTCTNRSFKDSSKSLIPWLFQATQQVQAPSTPSQLFPVVGVSYDHNPMIPYSHMETSVGQPALAQSPLIPSRSVIKRTSATLSLRNGIKFKDRMKTKFVSTRDPDIHQNSRKIPAVKEDYLMNPIKLPNLRIRDDSRAETQNESSVGGWILSESQYDGFGLSAGIDFSKVDAYGVTRLGPIKLSPGVKHILKPNQKVDQDNSRLNHSTIPFASVTDCGKMLETLKKSRKIYRF
ncbi:hypothetical protein Gogos_005527 [Gossypium gossypioides]|uniref:Uncharacterized protein n=1 Tax=Gossypium gossypioides TaxID=34282 RepID=A0A7J9D172_GOSGO|nr:hypothetical protein [Gossypium gossypioides]